MPEYQQFPAPVIIQSAYLGLIPNEAATELRILFAVDGVQAGEDVIQIDSTAKEKIRMIRAFPEMNRVGQVVQISPSTGCEISSCEIIADPLASFKIVKEVAEVQCSYKGNVTIQTFFDGTQLGSDKLLTSTDWKTEKFYLPAGSRGYVFQWKQVDNADGSERGYVASVDTDLALADLESPRVPVG